MNSSSTNSLTENSQQLSILPLLQTPSLFPGGQEQKPIMLGTQESAIGYVEAYLSGVQPLPCGFGATGPMTSLGIEPSAPLDAAPVAHNYSQLLPAITIVRADLGKSLNDPKLLNKLKDSYGDSASLSLAQELITNLATDLTGVLPDIRVVLGIELNGGNAAFSFDSLTGAGTILISSDFVAVSSDRAIADVLLEEVGHFIDKRINLKDALGDEGELFAANITDKFLSDIQKQQILEEDDHGLITVDGQQLLVEFSSTSFFPVKPQPIDIYSVIKPATYTFSSGFGSQTFLGNFSTANNNIQDFVSFKVNNPSQLTLNLSGFSSDLDFQLIQDRNQSTSIEPNEILASSNKSGLSSELISVPLAAGTYLIRIRSPLTGQGNTRYTLGLSTSSLGTISYTDPSPVRSYFGTQVTRSFFSGNNGAGIYATNGDPILMYGPIADYYSNNNFSNPNSRNGLFGIYSGLGLPTSQIRTSTDGTQTMDFEGGRLVNKNGVVTVNYTLHNGDRFDLVGSGSPDELLWKNDYSWFGRDTGKPTGLVRRVNSGWVQEFDAVNPAVGRSIFLLKDGQSVLGGFEKYRNDFGQEIDAPRGGPYRVQGYILDLYNLTGGFEKTSGGLGFPTMSSERSNFKGYKTYQEFENGFIGLTNDNRVIIRNLQGGIIPLLGYDGSNFHQTYTNTYNRNGGGTALGGATTNVGPWGNGYAQRFERGTSGAGAILKSNANDNSYWVGGSIWNRFNEVSGATGILGYPTTDRYSINGGWRQDFQGGSIYQTSRGIFTLFGGIGGRYSAVGGSQGFLGLPTSNEIGTGGGYITQNFENGVIRWNTSRATAFDIAIWNHYKGMGEFNSILRSPRSDSYQVNGGLRQDFEGGAIYKTSRGVFATFGGIGTYFRNVAGGENGRLGLPTSSETGIGGNSIRQNFEKGYIIWNGSSAVGYNNDGSLLFPPPPPPPTSSGTGGGSGRNYFPELNSLTNSDWDRYSGDNTRFDGKIWPGESNQQNLNPDSIKQIYTHLSIAVLGSRFSMTAGYIYDQSYVNGTGLYHAGIDIGATAGTSIRSLNSGTVAWVDSTNSSTNGHFVAIRDSNGRTWVYGHMQSLGTLRAGQQITAGQTIGQVGSQSSAKHLHLEVRTSSAGTGGAHRDQNFLINNTMSPLQAFWEINSTTASGSGGGGVSNPPPPPVNDSPNNPNPPSVNFVSPGRMTATPDFRLNNRSIWGQGTGLGRGINESFRTGINWGGGPLSLSAGVGFDFQAFMSAGTVNVDFPALFDISWQPNQAGNSVAVNFSSRLSSAVKFSTFLGAGFDLKADASVEAKWNILGFVDSRKSTFSGVGISSNDLMSGMHLPLSLDLGLATTASGTNRLMAEDTAYQALDILNTLALLPSTKAFATPLRDLGFGAKLGVNIKQETFMNIEGFEIDFDGIVNGNELRIGLNGSGTTNISLSSGSRNGSEVVFRPTVRPIVDFSTQFRIGGRVEASFDKSFFKLNNLPVPEFIQDAIKGALPKVSIVQAIDTPFSPPMRFATFNPYTVASSLGEIRVKV